MKTIVIAVSVALILIVGLAALAVRNFDASEASMRESGARLNEVREIAARAETKTAMTPQQIRIKNASEIWKTFDDLRGAQFRTREMLAAHLLRANQVAAGLPDDEAADIVAHNRAQFRKRLPALLIMGEAGAAYGKDSVVVSPSADPARCKKLATAWLSGPMREELLAVGYLGIVCPSPTGGDALSWYLDGRATASP